MVVPQKGKFPVDQCFLLFIISIKMPCDIVMQVLKIYHGVFLPGGEYIFPSHPTKNPGAGWTSVLIT